MGLLGKIGKDMLGGIVPGTAFGAGAGAMMTPEGAPGYQLGDNVAMGMGAGALAGAGAGGLKRIVQTLFQALKREQPGISDMEAWALAQRHAHDLEMAQRAANPPVSARPPLQLE